jgi:hypothetical protein
MLFCGGAKAWGGGLSISTPRLPKQLQTEGRLGVAHTRYLQVPVKRCFGLLMFDHDTVAESK